MKKLMKLIGCAALAGAALLALPRSAVAENIVETALLKADTPAVTNVWTFREGLTLDHITVANTAATTTNAVTVSIYDGGMAGASLFAYTLTNAEVRTVYPFRAVAYGSQTQALYTVHQFKITITAAEGVTNIVEAPVNFLFQGANSP